MIRQTHGTTLSFSALHEHFSRQLSLAVNEMNKRLDQVFSPKPISKMAVKLHPTGALEVDVESFLSSAQGEEILRIAEAHWRRWQQNAMA